MNRSLKKMVSFALLICLLLSFAQISSAEEQAVPKYRATSIRQLKLRDTPDLNARGIASIPENTTLDILEIVDDNFKVLYNNRAGYVQSKFFKNFQVNLPSVKSAEQAAPQPEQETAAGESSAKIVVSSADSSFNTEEPFTPRYKAKNTRAAALFKGPDEKSGFVVAVPRYSEELVLSQIKGDWAMAMYANKVGYIRTDILVQYDFIDPYAERFPGITNYQYAAVLPVDTPLYDRKNTAKVHKVIPAGAVIGVEPPDENGFMHVAYMKRRHALIKESNAIELVKVVPYSEAKKGDLISVFTSFFPVHNSNLDIIGRVYNMYHSADMLNGRVLQPGEQVSMNQMIGPYKKFKGYMKAPIASKVADTGYGGGTCQLNTTVYNTLLQVPVLVNHRRVHSKSGAVYVPVGFDAAVGSISTIDMKFTNTLPYPIMLQYYVSDNILTSLIYRAE